MFEATKVGRTVDKASFTAQQAALRTQLLEVQRELLHSDIPVVILICGVEGAGKGEVVNRLNEWLDTRGVRTFAFWDETDEERQRPRYWRFWNALPARGTLAILFGGWYQAPIEHRFQSLCNDAELDAELSRIADFERMLISDGALIVKFWFHLSEKDQKSRLKELSRDDRSRWKMMPKMAAIIRFVIGPAATAARKPQRGLRMRWAAMGAEPRIPKPRMANISQPNQLICTRGLSVRRPCCPN